MAERLKVVVFDDDPTGSQTVHSAPLLLRWDAASLLSALRHASPLLFLLANTRALAPAEAAERVRGICRSLRPLLVQAVAEGWIDRWLIVSRGDSTLRGHFPLEVEVIAEELGPFDATLLAPAFLPGGRTTVDGVHRLHGQPVHTTAFAADGLFAYRSSFLPAWVEEKSGGRIPAGAVQRISLAELEAAHRDPSTGGPLLRDRLTRLEGGTVVAVDAQHPGQLDALGAAVRAVTAPSADAPARRLLFQSAASLLNGLVPLPPQPRDAAGLAALRRRRPGPAGEPLPGLVLVGSHVPLADAQLEALLQEPGCRGVELPVARLARVLEGPEPERLLASLEQAWRERLQAVLEADLTPVLFTSRGEIRCRSSTERRQLGLRLAALMARLAASLEPQLGYLISKGGITSHTLLADGFALEAVELQGQLFAGLSMVLTPPLGDRAGLPVVTFPGNLGDSDSLRQAWRLMQQG
jgi:uncharacterized protein YgbK (DUF1537 family)